MRYTRIVLCFLSINLFATAVLAGPSANRIKDGPGLFDSLFDAENKTVSGESHQLVQQQASSDLRQSMHTAVFDGVWRDQQGRLLMLKQIHHSLFLSASDRHSAVQAQCVISGATAHCIGRGSSSVDGAFSYESKVNMRAKHLQVDWNFVYNSGNSDSGHSNYQKAL